MRTLIYSAFVSLDGVVDSPGGGIPSEQHRSGGWTFQDIEFLPEAYAIKGSEMEEAGAMMFGRRSYEAFAPIWPDIEDFAVVKEIPKYVVSTSLGDDALVEGWGPQTILRSLDEVAELKQGDGGPILIAGSAELARNLSDAGLIDRYHLLVFPVVLGAGKSMWSDTDKDKQMLKLVDSETYANGILKLVYDVVR
ncbi:dihydrofolate reductase family protein [Nocardioides sp. KC13]|uniref:Dihydrofolate reductase family protein n=1 Tax=Nocardioides turkmenicus TaxID=2711220 RepID=A0A6M1R695_9ACTN|nr:dihydrofolate reductase family protein [Nocardioides sp. KC13]NGN93139.1 dihydrofolate reductase family protein [Nocardioides sp. KC13]